MTVTEITTYANGLADENYSSTLILAYTNQCISKINIELNTLLPFISNTSTDYVALPDSWVMSLFVTYAAYGIKTNDGSLNEADRFLQIFNENLNLLAIKKTDFIAEAYQGADFEDIYQMDMSAGIDIGWFGNDESESDW